MNIRLARKNLFKIHVGRVHSKTYVGSTFKDIKELDLRKRYKYQAQKKAMTYSIRMRKRGNDEETEISFGQELSAKNKIQTTESLAVPYQYLNIVLELFTGAKQNCKNWIGKRGNC